MNHEFTRISLFRRIPVLFQADAQIGGNKRSAPIEEVIATIRDRNIGIASAWRHVRVAGKEVVFGLEEDGVGIAPTTENVSEEAVKLVDEWKQKILKGEVKVPATDEEFASFSVK